MPDLHKQSWLCNLFLFSFLSCIGICWRVFDIRLCLQTTRYFYLSYLSLHTYLTLELLELSVRVEKFPSQLLKCMSTTY
jgi:hypothetical protein